MKKIRLMALAAFAVISMSAMAQEGFGSLYAQYNISNMKMSYDGHSHSEGYNAASLGYSYAIPMSDALYLDLGVAGIYSWKSKDGSKLNMASAKIPINVFYGFEISDGIYIDPFAGVYARVGIWGETKYDGGKGVDIFKDWEDGGMGAKRFQVGLQGGVRLRLNKFLIGASYNQDLMEFAEHTKINSIDLTLGVVF